MIIIFQLCVDLRLEDFQVFNSKKGDGIVVEDMAVDTTKRFQIALPTNGGFAVKFSR